jgi:hypothetical protein
MYNSYLEGSNGAVESIAFFTLGTSLMHRILLVHAAKAVMYALSTISPRICISTTLLCTVVLHYAWVLQDFQNFVVLYA